MTDINPEVTVVLEYRAEGGVCVLRIISHVVDVTTVVYFIRARALNHRQFVALCFITAGFLIVERFALILHVYAGFYRQ